MIGSKSVSGEQTKAIEYLTPHELKAFVLWNCYLGKFYIESFFSCLRMTLSSFLNTKLYESTKEWLEWNKTFTYLCKKIDNFLLKFEKYVTAKPKFPLLNTHFFSIS
jgi:hypothetical protein